ncbi:glycerophosphoryl diester phosphodiesterase [Novosphingobium sp. PhB165]|uniref:glycerophosphodiester phosphodiesterase family protein n=1 Tax=Novosphingobium sp. PhB165 TaxID=2485105 RepID=UPI0010441D8E|nr:glycerophosphodiester phosphodiesterase family protein [Novosphingobium sp. PhB165]TCM16978.1 glycerophosphoryl diester phosphodiesterase [Novosphingobium sp. PhB165]
MLLASIDRWLAPPPDPKRVGWVGAHDFAHRGLHDAGVPENSLAAFEAALRGGFGIELDVQRASDGTAVVFHDDVLDRLTGESGPVSRRSAAQLATIRLTGSEQTIPSLRRVLDTVAGRVPVLIEVKSGLGTRVTALCLAVRRVLEGYAGDHAVMSFDPRVLHWFRVHSPHTVRGLVVSEGEDRALPGTIRRHLSLWKGRPDFLAYDVRDLPSRFARGQRERGLPVASWTIRTDQQQERVRLHADAAIFEQDGEPAA